MKKYSIIKLYLCLFLLISLSQVACNIAEEGSLQSTKSSTFDQTKTGDEELSTEVTSSDFKKMSIEEQWQIISAGRRDDLRRRYKAGEALDVELKKVISKDLDFEINEVAPEPSPRVLTEEQKADFREQHDKIFKERSMSSAEMWKLFSDRKKEYIRENAEKYPQFKPFF